MQLSHVSFLMAKCLVSMLELRNVILLTIYLVSNLFPREMKVPVFMLSMVSLMSTEQQVKEQKLVSCW